MGKFSFNTINREGGAMFKPEDVEESEFEKLQEIYKLFACNARLKILVKLSSGEYNASELAEFAQLTQSAASHQLKDLKKSRVIKSRKEGKNVIYSLADHHILHILTTGIEHVKGVHCNV